MGDLSKRCFSSARRILVALFLASSSVCSARAQNETGHLVYVTKPVLKGTLIRSEDVTRAEVEQAEVSAKSYTSPILVVGRKASHDLAVGQSISDGDINWAAELTIEEQKIAESEREKALAIWKDSANVLWRMRPVGFPRFFPPEIDDSREQWYSAALLAFREKRIWQPREKLNGDTIRFLWLRSFAPSVCIRVNCGKEGDAVLYGKQSSGRPGEGGHIKAERIVSLDHTAYSKLERSLNDIGFFDLPTIYQSDRVCHDGDQWIVEAQLDGRYHVVDRHSSNNEDLRKIGILLLKQAGLLPPRRHGI